MEMERFKMSPSIIIGEAKISGIGGETLVLTDQM